MTKLNSAELVQFVNSASTTAPSKAVTIVGVIKDATDSAMQFSGDNFATWLSLPTGLVDEAKHLGVVEGFDPGKSERFPLFSITLKAPSSETERFLLELLGQTTRALTVVRQTTSNTSGCSCNKAPSVPHNNLTSSSDRPQILSGCYACSTQYRCYRQCWDANGSWYWGYDPVCC